MSRTNHPYLTATLGEAALRLPPELAQPLEAAFAAANEAPASIDLPSCLQRIRAGDAADGQPWTGPASTPGQRWPPHADRAAVGLVSLLELYHAAERVRVDGEEKDDIGDGTREGLMLDCRGWRSMWRCRCVAEAAAVAVCVCAALMKDLPAPYSELTHRVGTRNQRMAVSSFSFHRLCDRRRADAS